MNKTSLVIISVLVIVAIAAGAFFIINRNNTQKVESERISQTDTQKETPEAVVEEKEVGEEKSPIAFSKIGKGIMDAKEIYSYFSFENGAGTCMDQGFPTNMIYTSENIAKTSDDKYIEDYTAVDFLGNVRFDNLPLTTGAAACVFETSLDSDVAKLDCTVNEVSVCTATFDLFGHK